MNLTSSPQSIIRKEVKAGEILLIRLTKFTKEEQEIDVIPLNTVVSIAQRRLEASIENYLSGVPLTIQAIAYDIETGQLLGDVGIQAITNRTLGINNRENAIVAAQKKEKFLEEFIQEKAQSLGFTPIYS